MTEFRTRIQEVIENEKLSINHLLINSHVWIIRIRLIRMEAEKSFCY